MLIRFHKYQGTGNDFVMVDGRDGSFNPTTAQVAALCDRRFGIGADGLIIVREEADGLRMVYFNSDGRESTMCGNGGRCFVAFCHALGIIGSEGRFMAIDGPHDFLYQDGTVSLRMQDVPAIEALGDDMVLDTGSPHYVRFCHNVGSLDVQALGSDIRNGERFRQAGINVNFVEKEDDALRVRTFERGVEGETYSCGTGVTAAVLAFDRLQNGDEQSIAVRTLGGELAVSFVRAGRGGYTDIWLHGPAKAVFTGEVEVMPQH
jgi:diaminopimelate epimerase